MLLLSKRHNCIRIACAALATLLLLLALPSHAAASSSGVTTSDVILRTKPSASSVPLATIRADREIILLENQGDWYKVKTGSLVGYVMTKYIKASSGAPSGGGSASSSSGEASASSSALRSGDKGTEVQVLQQSLKKLGFFNDEATGNFGPMTEAAVKAYQAARGLSADGVAGPATLGQIARDASEVIPSASAALVRKGDEGDTVAQIQQALKNLGHFSDDITGYFGLKTEQALIAFQQASGLSADGVAGSSTLDKLLNAPSSSGGASLIKLGDKGTAVSNLQSMLKGVGFYSGSIDGDFGEGTQKALVAYQQASGLSADGVAGTQTLTLLSSGAGAASPPIVSTGSTETQSPPIISSSNSGGLTTIGSGGSLGGGGGASDGTIVSQSQSNGSLHLVDWWSGEIDRVFPRRAVCSLLDVRTGISLNIYRFGGTNHLDFEPATAADTELFLQISGGVGSWSARPVILTINGKRYAAAMNTMGHGEEHLADNNFQGQCCIHFLNSWTHGGRQVNQDMQTQIMVAYNSGK